MQLKPEIS